MTTDPGRWSPLLTGATAAQAHAVLANIAYTLARPGRPGTLGDALWVAYVDSAAPALPHADLERLLVDAVPPPTPGVSLYGGLAGTGWVLEHLQIEAGGTGVDDEDLNCRIAQLLDQVLVTSRWNGWTDLFSGLTGLGVYALERLPGATAARCLARIVEHLDQLAERSGGGVTWLTRPEQLIPASRRQHPRGCYPLGVAHGIPAIVSVLAGAHAAGIEPDRARRLYGGAIAWLLDQRFGAHEAETVFPAMISGNRRPAPTTAGWCYGDPGVAGVLFSAAHVMGDDTLAEEALAVARRAAARALTHTGVTSACLCHGAAGVAHIFNRLGQSSGDPLLAAAARRWFELVLAMPLALDATANAGGGLEGSFLAGLPGIALALLAAVTDVEPAWDRLMVLSIA